MFLFIVFFVFVVVRICFFFKFFIDDRFSFVFLKFGDVFVSGVFKLVCCFILNLNLMLFIDLSLLYCDISICLFFFIMYVKNLEFFIGFVLGYFVILY